MKLAIRLCSVLTVAALLLATSSARADFEIDLSTDGVTYTTVYSAPSDNTSGNAYTNHSYNSTFDISILSGDSNSPGDAIKAFLESSDTHIKNISGSTATLWIKIGDTSFTAPTAPPTLILSSHIGGTVTTGGAGNLMTFQSYVDPTNGQDSTAGFTSGPQNPNVTSSSNGGSFSSDASSAIPVLAADYSITEFFKVTLDPNAQLGWQSNTQLQVPEPASMALWGLGLAVAGLVARKRRRG